MSDEHQPERRTFSQERFEILIKRQKNGTATFRQLTELDEIVNRDPELRERVIRENIFMEDPAEPKGPTPESKPDVDLAVHKTLAERIRESLSRVFIRKTTWGMPSNPVVPILF